METEIKITAEISQDNAAICKFTVDSVVLPEGCARFTSKASAQDSPLAQKIFEIAGIASMDVYGRTIIVRKDVADTWRTIGPLVGAAIRAHLRTGQPAVGLESMRSRPAEQQLRGAIQRILREEINPAVASHGGSIALLDVHGDTVFIQMSGGCQGCGQASVTLREGVERTLREQVPGVGDVVDVSDHAAGTNPYYTSAK